MAWGRHPELGATWPLVEGRPMSADANQAVVLRYFTLVNDGLSGALGEEVFALGYRLHLDSGQDIDRHGAIGLIEAFLAAFPGLHHAIEDLIVDGDRVATRVVISGAHKGELMGIAPTGRNVAFTAMYFHRLEDGR